MWYNPSMVDEVGTIINWSFPEYEVHERSRRWWFVFYTIFGALLSFALLTLNFLFALIIIMFIGVILYRHYHEPRQMNFVISGRGINLNNNTIPWREIKSFWLAYDPPRIKTLVLELDSKISRYLIVPLLEQNPLEIHDILSSFLEENLENETEPLFHEWGRLLRL